MKLSFIFAVVLVGLIPCWLQGQTPTLSQAAAHAGMTGNASGTANNFKFYLDPGGYPRAVTQGETIVMMGSWPTGNNPTMTDDQSNTWTSVPSCADSQGLTHGFFYAINAKAGTSAITETHGALVHNGVFDWAHFYNMNASASGFVEGSSCKNGMTPTSNTPPNITGTAYTISTANDLVITCVYVENSTLSAPNAISSITWPTNFTGLSEDLSFGHACAYSTSALNGSTGSFTPTFTIAQSSHDTFTIMSAAFKAGNGGSPPQSGASVTLSEALYTGGGGFTMSPYLPCPANTSAVVVGDDAGDVGAKGAAAVSDNNSNSWSALHGPGDNYGPIWYANNPTISSTNSYRVNLPYGSSGNNDLVTLYCVTGTNGIDTAVTAQNGATPNGPGSTYNGACTTSGGVCAHISSLGTSAPYDLVFNAGAFGQGPATSCVTGRCVFDYVGSTTWTSGDAQSYSNGDVMAHVYVPAVSTVSFDFNVASGVTGGSALSLAFRESSSSSILAPPSGLTAVVH